MYIYTYMYIYVHIHIYMHEAFQLCACMIHADATTRSVTPTNVQLISPSSYPPHCQIVPLA